uniref:Uncharacterized protein n=1 Tax=Rhizophora mucronata TaxID=61149 RepID=A0A2P2IKJ3_RHIMU
MLVNHLQLFGSWDSIRSQRILLTFWHHVDLEALSISCVDKIEHYSYVVICVVWKLCFIDHAIATKIVCT